MKVKESEGIKEKELNLIFRGKFLAESRKKSSRKHLFFFFLAEIVQFISLI